MKKEFTVYVAYIKRRGFNCFYKIAYTCRLSNRGYKIATPIEQEAISKCEYYKKLGIPHYIVDIPRKEIHEFGNEKFFEIIGY